MATFLLHYSNVQKYTYGIMSRIRSNSWTCNFRACVYICVCACLWILGKRLESLDRGETREAANDSEEMNTPNSVVHWNSTTTTTITTTRQFRRYFQRHSKSISHFWLPGFQDRGGGKKEKIELNTLCFSFQENELQIIHDFYVFLREKCICIINMFTFLHVCPCIYWAYGLMLQGTLYESVPRSNNLYL